MIEKMRRLYLRYWEQSIDLLGKKSFKSSFLLKMF